MRILTLVTVIGLLAASCGGSDDESPSAAGFSDKTTIDDSSATTTATTAITTTEAPEADLDRYCELRTTAEAESDVYFDSDDLLDPTATEAFFARQSELLDQAIEIASPDIGEALAAVLDRQNRIETLVSGNGYDMLGSFDELQADPTLEIPPEVEDLLDDYDFENCGIVADDDSTTSDGEGAGSQDGSTESTQIESKVTLEEAADAVASLSDPESFTDFVAGMTEEFPDVSIESATCIGTDLSAEELLALLELVRPGSTVPQADNTAESALVERVIGCGATMAQIGL